MCETHFLDEKRVHIAISAFIRPEKKSSLSIEIWSEASALLLTANLTGE